MRHVDPTTLALIALGEPAATHRDTHHIESCRRCANYVGERSNVVALARAAASDGASLTPRAEVWLAIRAELGLSNAQSGSAVRPSQRRGGAIAVASVSALMVAAVVVGMLVMPALTVGRVRVLASATLEAFPLWPDASGVAVARERSDGSRELVVELREPVRPGSTREVWLLTRNTTELVSLGVLEGSTGLFEIPDGLDLTQWQVVDISEEPPDGNPAHSGDSIVRGPLV